MGHHAPLCGSSAGDPHIGDNVAISLHAEQSPSFEMAKASFRAERLFLASLIISHCIFDGENHRRTFVISDFGGGQLLFFFLSLFCSPLLAVRCTFSRLFPRMSEKHRNKRRLLSFLPRGGGSDSREKAKASCRCLARPSLRPRFLQIYHGGTRRSNGDAWGGGGRNPPEGRVPHHSGFNAAICFFGPGERLRRRL